MKHPIASSLSPGRRALFASTVAVLFGTAAAVAQSSSTGTTRSRDYGDSTTSSTSASTVSSGKLGWMDKHFVTKAADGGAAEVQLAQLAAQRATNPEVKTFAQKIVDDHTKVNSELTALASQKSVKLDNDDDKDRVYKRLSKKSGADFDQEFVEHMIDEHEKDIKMFEKASRDAKDSDVRSFASKHIADLRSHLQQAEGLRQSVMPTGRMADRSGRSGRSTPGGNPSSTYPTPTTDTATPSSTPDGTSSSTTPKPDSSR